MATFRNGGLGGIKGTIGPVVACRWKGIDYIRSRPTTTKGKRTEGQKGHTAKFVFASRFLHTMKTLLNITFKEGKGVTGVNKAFSHTLKTAVVGIYPQLEIDYKMVLVARGQLPNAAAPAIANNGTTLEFWWTDNSGIGIARPTDQVVLVAHHARSNASVYTIGTAVRSAEKASLDLAGLDGETVETWIAFLSENGKEVSDSIYLGRVQLS